ncbi:hypothetical protein Dehly_1496 [Dehalogenimonas lykanthroporepellens BL-DC-9]|jgi:hypothetical protein|nr:hypothetical protein Dehly_1496 [Dehalogenimonas lykanthroporepellens BL-DC-9]
MIADNQQMLFIVLPQIILWLLLLLSFRFSMLKVTVFNRSQDTDEVDAARHQLRKAGLVIMAIPVAIILGFTAFATFRYGAPGYGLVFALPLAAVWLLTRQRPLLGASMAAMATVMLIIPGISALVMNYEMTAWYGSIMLLLAAMLGLGAWTTVKSLPRTRKVSTHEEQS